MSVRCRIFLVWQVLVMAVLWFNTSTLMAEIVVPPYFSAKPGSLVKAKERLADGDKDLARALKKLVADADEALRVSPPSVTEKSKIPPSGDKHDYMSLAPYFWPDPKTKDGLPYVRNDGRVNPESRDPRSNDSPRVALMGSTVETLSLAYFFTGNEAYAHQAAAIARVWFLDPKTRMNPNFKYAQAVLGVNDGRGTGILEARHIAIAIDAVKLLTGSKSWSVADQLAINAWGNAFFNWILTSDAGKDERSSKNNHGTWYDVQTARLALCLGHADIARRIVEEAKERRVAIQIEPDGRQPLELVRTTSFSYSRFNLEALCELATLGEYAGVDLWHFKTADGRCIQKALNFLLPYLENPAKRWPYEQIKDKHDKGKFMPILRQAALAYQAPEYEAILTKNSDTKGKIFQLMFVK
jgi:Alginate lyase